MTCGCGCRVFRRRAGLRQCILCGAAWTERELAGGWSHFWRVRVEGIPPREACTN